MIIFGKRTAFIGSKKSSLSTTCNHCQTAGKITYSIFRSHAHVFWIPMFPIGRKAISECQHCKQTLRFKEMSAAMKKESSVARKEAKGPIWQFSGLFIFPALIVFAFFIGKRESVKEAEYLSNPLVGDVYNYYTDSSQYSTMRIVHLNKDSIYVQLNNYEIGRSSKTYTIDKEKNYSKKAYGYSKKEIKEMYEQKIIVDIDRK